VRRPARSGYVRVRGLRLHVQLWGGAALVTPQRPPLVMLHGWMDVAASFQFVVDALREPRFVIAPDWRGFGLSDTPAADSYWFPDYLGDLDALLDALLPDQPVDLLGHSMGGNVAMAYAGIRPERIRRLVNLEGFGGPKSRADQAPQRYRRWFDELKACARGELDLSTYDSADGVARRLTKTNPRLARDQAGRDKAAWLARQWARENDQGRWAILGDPAHKIISANLIRVDELLELYKRLNMPVLAVEASDDPLPGWWKGKFSKQEYHERLRLIPDCRIEVVQDAGHMLHHDQPEALARLLEQFLR
jgi:pimeloyl-ACP methyl ester carboxylesterase